MSFARRVASTWSCIPRPIPGFDLQSVGGPTSRFLGLTVRGAVVGDEDTQQVPADLAALVQDELAEVLRESQIRPEDVRVAYGRVVLYWRGAGRYRSATAPDRNSWR